MIYIDLLLYVILPFAICATIVFYGIVAIAIATMSNKDKSLRLALFLSGVSAILLAGDKLKEMYNYEKTTPLTAKEIRV